MKLRYTILYVADVATSLGFYERAFGLERGMLHEGGDYGELATGNTKLAFSSLDLMRQIGKAPGRASEHPPVFEIAFETETVDEAFEAALKAGAESVQPPEHMPWGQTVSYVRDPDGFLIEICSPVRGSPS